MKLKIWLSLVILFTIHIGLTAITLADLDIQERDLIEQFVIDYDQEITIANFESLENVKYSIIYITEEYIIIVIDDEIILIPVEE